MDRTIFRRLAGVLAGQVVSAMGLLLMIWADVGLDPWNVLHQGICIVTGISLGKVTILAGAGIIALSLILGERIGVGTILGVVVPGMIIDLVLSSGFSLEPASFPGRLALLLLGLEILTIGTWLYMRQCLGTGPRDSLNVAIARKLPISVGVCRSGIELLVTVMGWLLGARVGVGTVVSAFGIGILFQLNFRMLRFEPKTIRQETLFETVARFRRVEK